MCEFEIGKKVKYPLFFTVALSLLLFAACRSDPAKKTETAGSAAATEIKEVSPAAAQVAVSQAYSQFIDVRTPEEYAAGHAARSENIPLDTLNANFNKLYKKDPVYIICQTGNRSKKAAEILKAAGFNQVVNVTGGTVAWEAANLPMETKKPHNTPQPK